MKDAVVVVVVVVGTGGDGERARMNRMYPGNQKMMDERESV